MINWLAKKGVAGWTSVVAEADGLYGVTVQPPAASGGKPRVIKFASVPGGRLDAESLTQLSHKISVFGCPWTLSLGRDAYDLLVVPEPTVQANELEQSLRWSISTMTDRSLDDVRMSFIPIPTKDKIANRPSNLYVAFAKNGIIAEHNSIFQRAAIRLEAIDVREMAQRNIAALAEKPGKGLGLLFVGEQGVRLTITCNRALYLDRFIEGTLSINALNDADAEQRAYERVVLQIQRSLDFIGRSLTFIEIDSILVVSIPGTLNLVDQISQQLQIPVETLDLASVLDFTKTPELTEKETQAVYFTALGAALRFNEAGQQINLQPRREKSGFIAVWAELAVLGLVLLSLLGYWGMRQGEVTTAREAEAVGALRLQEAQARLQALTPHLRVYSDAEMAALKSSAATAQIILAQVSSLGSQQGYAQHFSLLAGVAEKDLWLTNVAISKAGTSVTLSGRALNKESVLRYAQRLNSQFAGNGVQFTTLELTPESVGRQGDKKPPLTTVMFRLY